MVTTATDLAFNNRDNGDYVLTVRALDRAGKLGGPALMLALQLSNYQVVTRVDRVEGCEEAPGAWYGAS